MLSYIKKYPISLFIILTVIYLSFFKPPKTDLDEIPNFDKLVHVCMHSFALYFLVVVWNCCRNIALHTGVETGWTLQLILRERFWLV